MIKTIKTRPIFIAIFSLILCSYSEQGFGYVPFFNLLADLVDIQNTSHDLDPETLIKKLISVKDQIKSLEESPNKIDPTPKEVLELLKDIKNRLNNHDRPFFTPIEEEFITEISKLVRTSGRLQEYYEKESKHAEKYIRTDKNLETEALLLQYLALRVKLWCAEHLKTSWDDNENYLQTLPHNSYYLVIDGD